jgi:hypothetical protein
MGESIVTLRVPPDRVESWKRLAAGRGLTVSQLIRGQMELVEADSLSPANAEAPAGIARAAEVGAPPVTPAAAVVDAGDLPAPRRLRSVSRLAEGGAVSSGRPAHHPRCSCFVCSGRLSGASS